MPLFQSARVSTAQMPVPTRHMGFYAEEDLFDALEEERYVGRHPNRSATIVALLREALDARARSRGEADEAWIALERDTPKAGAKAKKGAV